MCSAIPLALLFAASAHAQLAVRTAEEVLFFNPTNGQLLNRLEDPVTRPGIGSGFLPSGITGLTFDRGAGMLLTSFEETFIDPDPFRGRDNFLYTATHGRQIAASAAGVIADGPLRSLPSGPNNFIRSTAPRVPVVNYTGTYVDSLGRMVWADFNRLHGFAGVIGLGGLTTGLREDLAVIPDPTREFVSLTYDRKRDLLFAGDADGSIYRIDLTNQLAILAGTGPTAAPVYSSVADDKFYWLDAQNRLLISDGSDMFNTRTVGPLELPADFLGAPRIFGFAFIDISPVPEPGSLALVGAVGLTFAVRRRRR